MLSAHGLAIRPLAQALQAVPSPAAPHLSALALHGNFQGLPGCTSHNRKLRWLA